MFIYLTMAGFIIIIFAGVMANTRTARLKRLARTLHMQFNKRLDNILTEGEMQQSFFFGQGWHRFYQVLTLHEPGAFMRICEDRIFESNTATAPTLTYTLVTAELTRGSFTPLILMPARTQQPTDSHPALPAELAPHYTLSAPDNYQLPEMVLGFLKAAKPCYIELTPNTIIYHEFDTKPVSQLQPLRFRVRQLIEAFIKRPEVSPTTEPQKAVNPATEAELQATMLLKMQSASRSYSQAAGQGNSTRWVYGIVFLAILIGLCLLTNYVLQHGVAK